VVEPVEGVKTALIVQPKQRYLPLYRSIPEDQSWANAGMVASVISGDSSLHIQQQFDDAGFNNVIVTPMGSDRAFLHCSNKADIWQVFNDAIDFFGMLFANVHKWTLNDIQYERGAWLRLYGTPAHAWNEMFSKLCATTCGRFIKADECTVDKGRLDFARILILTSSLEIVNNSTELLIDGIRHTIKLVEEWGSSLGEDAFLSEEEVEARSEQSVDRNFVHDMEEVQGEVNELVNDLEKAWDHTYIDADVIMHKVPKENITH